MRSAPMLRVMADEAAAPVSVFRQIAEASLRRDPAEDEIRVLGGLARPKDLPILAAAVRERCDGLVTFDERDYRPGYPGVEVVPPSRARAAGLRKRRGDGPPGSRRAAGGSGRNR